MTARDGGGGIGQRIGSAFIEVGASFAGFGDTLAGDVTNSLIAQTAVIGNALESLGQVLFSKFTVPVALATAANIAQFQALDNEIRTTMTLFGTAPSLIQPTFDALSDGVRSVAKEVGGLESDIADGLYQTISAGIPRGDAFEFLDVAQMAAMSDKTADLTTAVDGLTTVVNAFGLETSETERIADVMFQTVALGKTTFGELSSDIGRVAPLAANAGIAFEELFSVIGALTLQGLSTSEAISFLRAGITGLLRPTEELNAIFGELGFTSAEAAIPVLGLQGAFQAVFDAAGGSTSQLQELIGTSEGVSAALGIVGDNAATFDRIFSGINNSTGATARAFEIMDTSVGRSFGRMTESFDRLGNTFGELGSGLVVPAVEVIADIVSNLADRMDSLLPIARNLGEVVGFFFSAFDIPVIREFVTIVVAMTSGIYGLLGVIGAASLVMGKFITAALQIKTVQIVWEKFGGLIRGIPAVMGNLSTTFANLSSTLGRTVPQIGLLSTASQGLSNIFRVLSTSPLLAGGLLAGVGIAITGLVVLFSNLRDSMKEASDAANVFGVQADILADALGLVNQQVNLIDLGEGETNMNDLEQTARGLINTLIDVKLTLGDLASQDILEAIAIDLIWKGNTPEDAIAAVEEIGKLAGIEVDIAVTDITDATDQIEQFGEAIEANLSFLEVADDANQFRGIAESIGEQLTTLFAISRQSGDFGPFLRAVEQVQNQFAATTGEAETLTKRVKEAFQDEGLEFSFFDTFTLNPETILQQLKDAGAIIETSGFEIEIPYNPVPANTGDAFFAEGPPQAEIISPEQMEAFRATASELQLTVDEVRMIGEEGVATYEGLLAGIDSTFTAVREQVQGAMEDIRTEIEAQQPLLDIYTGKIKQSFDEWKTGQDQFQEDIKAVTTLRETLIESNLPQALIDAFDRQPIEKQAWLAGLGEDQLHTALDELAESFDLTQTEADTRITQSMDQIMTDAQTTLNAKYAELQNEALSAGGVVADNFNERFDMQAKAWEATAATYIGLLTEQLNVVIPGPTIGAPNFAVSSGLPTVASSASPYQTNITVNNPSTSDLEGDLNRAKAISETTYLLGTVS